VTRGDSRAAPLSSRARARVRAGPSAWGARLRLSAGARGGPLFRAPVRAVRVRVPGPVSQSPSLGVSGGRCPPARAPPAAPAGNITVGRVLVTHLQSGKVFTLKFNAVRVRRRPRRRPRRASPSWLTVPGFKFLWASGCTVTQAGMPRPRTIQYGFPGHFMKLKCKPARWLCEFLTVTPGPGKRTRPGPHGTSLGQISHQESAKRVATIIFQKRIIFRSNGPGPVTQSRSCLTAGDSYSAAPPGAAVDQ
jgi:hypothetical protein